MSQSRASQQENDFFAPDKGERCAVVVSAPVNKSYDYAVPSGMQVEEGDYVSVPLGPRKITAVVWGAAKDDVPAAKIKPVGHKFDVPPMRKEVRVFLEKLAAYNMADLGSVLAMALPHVKMLEPFKPDLAYAAGTVEGKITEKRQAVLDALSGGQVMRGPALAKHAGCSPAVIKAMVEAGMLVTVEQSPAYPCTDPKTDHAEITLSDDQAKAAKVLCDAVDAEKFKAVLLDGVTGAGKTEVYFEAVSEALRKGKQVLILLPEIALSAQLVMRFEKHFGVKPAVWHSDVTAAKKKRVWRGIAAGETKVVIGARSALFMPFTDLGLVIVDEEHDASFKQEEGVIYNARDMAVLRASIENVPVILVSATPSLETVINAQQGKYDEVVLPARHGGATLPEVHVIDLKQEKMTAQCFIAEPLREVMRNGVKAGEQTMLFLNRRGYAPLTLCGKCGHRLQCPSCTAWLVEHKYSGRLHCHHCGLVAPMPKSCENCGAEDSFRPCGPGVERVAEEVKSFMPEARQLVISSDLMQSPEAIEQALGDIQAGKVDVIIGTQILAKGHHFPALTSVGVVDADLGLAGGDLRASERTYQLLHQVSGRAGREQKQGHVYLQTTMPDHKVLQALMSHDRDAFVAVEAEEREAAEMPPYGRLAALIVTGPEERKLDEFCAVLARSAPFMEDVRILGPAPAALAIIRGTHRRRFLIKTGKNVAIQKMIKGWLQNIKIPHKIRVKIDIDPQSFL